VVPDRISREVVIDAPPEKVWTIVTKPRHVARWFSDEAEIDLQPGGAMLLTWHGHGAYRGRVDLVDPPRRFAFRWLRREDNEPGDGTSTLVEPRSVYFTAVVEPLEPGTDHVGAIT